MVKKYKLKSYKELDSTDKHKLSSKSRRFVEKHNRSQAKSEIRDILREEVVNNDISDDYYELEIKMASLCYDVSKIDPNYKCTCPCPENEKLASDHIHYLQSLLTEDKLKKQ